MQSRKSFPTPYESIQFLSLCVVPELSQVQLGEQGPADYHSSGGAVHGEAAQILCQRGRCVSAP